MLNDLCVLVERSLCFSGEIINWNSNANLLFLNLFIKKIRCFSSSSRMTKVHRLTLHTGILFLYRISLNDI